MLRAPPNLTRGAKLAGMRELVRMVQNLGLPKDEAELIVKLLYFYRDDELERAGTYQELIDHLDHPNLAVRRLAAWWLREGLAYRVPARALAIPYDPDSGREERRKAVALWKQLLPPGTVPQPAQKGSGAG